MTPKRTLGDQPIEPEYIEKMNTLARTLEEIGRLETDNERLRAEIARMQTILDKQWTALLLVRETAIAATKPKP